MLLSDKPVGMLIAGRPAKFAGIVHKSERYISRGFSVFSPNLNAGDGVVGDIKNQNHQKLFENPKLSLI